MTQDIHKPAEPNPLENFPNVDYGNPAVNKAAKEILESPAVKPVALETSLLARAEALKNTGKTRGPTSL